MAGDPAPGRASCTRQGIPHQAGPPSPGRASAPGSASCTRQGILLGQRWEGLRAGCRAGGAERGRGGLGYGLVLRQERRGEGVLAGLWAGSRAGGAEGGSAVRVVGWI